MEKAKRTKAVKANRLQGLIDAVARLRHQYRTSSTKIELGLKPDPFKRVQAQRQLKLLVPLLRVMKAMEQQGNLATDKTQALLAKRLANIFEAVDQMLDWADGSEKQDAELLALCLPATAAELQLDPENWVSLGEHLERQRAIRYAQRTKMRSLTSKFVASLSSEQRSLLQKYFELSGGRAFEVTPQMLARSTI